MSNQRLVQYLLVVLYMFFGKVYYHLLSTGETNIPWIAFYPLFDSESGLILCIGHRNSIHP